MEIFVNSFYPFTGTLKGTGVIDDIVDLVWSDRYNMYGDFKLRVPLSAQNASLVVPNAVLRIKESGSCMIVETIEILFDEIEGNVILASGRSFESVMMRRVFLDERRGLGKIHTVLKDFFEANIGRYAPIWDRAIAGFDFLTTTDPTITAIDVNLKIPRGAILYNVFETTCKDSGIGFRLFYDETYSDFGFRMELYNGIDRSNLQSAIPRVLFSPLVDNVLSSRYFYTEESFRTFTIVEGGEKLVGGGTALQEVNFYPASTGIFRREMYTDATNYTRTIDDVTMSEQEYLVLLNNKGKEDLRQYKTVEAFEGDVDPYGIYKYKEDFFLGDIVEISNQIGASNRSRITEIIISASRSGLKVYPTFEIL